MMKPTAILINTCRGPVVDEQALYDALAQRRIRGAGIDAFWNEPPDPGSPFFKLDNVVLMPHCAAGTLDAELEGIKHAFNNIARFDSGEVLSGQDIASVGFAKAATRN